MPAPKDFGDALGRIGTWTNDLLFGQKQKHVEPSYQINYGQMDEDRQRQAALYQQFQQMSAGNGPSLAQGQLQQATDQNIRQAMALGAAQQGQGMGYSSALRGIADQSAAARQQAAAQSALIRNQEQMQGMQGMGALGGQMFGQDLARQGLGAQTAYGYDSMNAGIDARNAQPGGVFGSLLNAGGAVLSHFLGGGGGAANSNLQSGSQGLTSGSGPVMSDGSGFRGAAPQPGDWTSGNVAHAAHGGMIGYADGGVVVDPKMRALADYLRANYRPAGSNIGRRSTTGMPPMSDDQRRTDKFIRSAPEHLYASGGPVPGYAQGGDSKRNDTVPAMLSPGEIVIPRSITMAPNAGELSRMFVEEVQRRRQRGSPSMEHPYVRQAGRKAA